tara:strand:- start:62 stop:622 length:561 start_codon:yes stop_codon:yes gene_type:complete
MKQLFKNPQFDSYKQLKEFVLSPYCKWTHIAESIPPDGDDAPNEDSKYKNTDFYAHSFLARPRDDVKRYPTVEDSEFIDLVSTALCDIMLYNGFCIRSFYRICANATHPFEKIYSTVPHQDHSYEHGNVILYLTDAGGKTFVETENNSDSYEYHDPKEDDVFLFSGKHYNETPKDKRRVIIVATFM